MSAPLPDWLPEDIDSETPSVARIYDYMLGGFANFEVDRAIADGLARTDPDLIATTRAYRAFLRRVVKHLVAEAGVHQFLDLGSGIPTAGNVHEIAHAIDPRVRVAYVDIDPVAVAIGRQLLTGDSRLTAMRGDITRIEPILDDPAVTGLLDFTEPVAVLMLGVLHVIPDRAGPHAIIDRVRERLSAGSYLAISHGCNEGPPELVAKINTVTRSTSTAAVLRSRAEIATLFDGFDLIEPGLVDLPRWNPDEIPDDIPATLALGGVAGLATRP
ncbi:SAM-dependent methyltransferase [Nocardia sp. GAS34]|uniref:SAM-dependent methyltransferase n=1 Tax=unclassified Nocardia TaxID=2637762 RepID=UPI003D1DC1AF